MAAAGPNGEDAAVDALATRRRVLLGGITMVAAAAGLFDVTPAGACRRVGRADVARIEAVTALYRSLDYEHGGGILVTDVSRFAEAACRLLDQSYPVSLAPSHRTPSTSRCGLDHPNTRTPADPLARPVGVRRSPCRGDRRPATFMN